MEFYLYKGLKKPLVFFGLKDKYIYYALGSALLGIVCLAVLPSFISYFGVLLGGVIGGGGVWYTFTLQKSKGLYNKQKNHNELHIFPKRFKNKIPHKSYIEKIQNLTPNSTR